MTTYYKLTTQNNRSAHGDLTWGEGITHSVAGPLVLSKNGIHVYTDPVLALFLNPIDANITTPVVWTWVAEGDHTEGQLKIAVQQFTTIRIVEVQSPTLPQRVTFGILAALEVYREPRFLEWTEKWLSGQDRSRASARAAGAAAWAAAADVPINFAELATRAMQAEHTT